MNQAKLFALPLIAAMLSPAIASAEDGASPSITPYADIRYRLELVDQDGLSETATASTLRVRAGIKTSEWNGFSALVEGEAIARLGPKDYNDTVNGRTAYPVVADPTDVLLNQAWIKFKPVDEVAFTGGRQAINLDNQRWVGSVGWRQNDQTFDAVWATINPAKGVSADYLYSWRVNRIFGPDSPQGIWHDTSIHGARVAVSPAKDTTITAYGYWLGIPAAATSNSKTFGVRLAGAQPIGGGAKLLYAAEYARQSDHASNPVDFGLDYIAIEPGVAAKGFIAKLGYEQLEGNGTVALQTPLATGHAFNGWADVFLSTPASGLRDIYGDISYKFGDGSPVKDLLLKAVYHDFRSTTGSLDYGSEWNALAAYPLNKKINLTLKFARYNADSFATDRTKAWFSVDAKF